LIQTISNKQNIYKEAAAGPAAAVDFCSFFLEMVPQELEGMDGWYSMSWWS